MAYLVRFHQEKPHPIAHHVHQVSGVWGALCSQAPTPAAADASQNGVWEMVEDLPPGVRLCHICQKVKHKLDNPLPARVERDLEKLALWDPRAAALQREKMLQVYRRKRNLHPPV